MSAYTYIYVCLCTYELDQVEK